MNGKPITNQDTLFPGYRVVIGNNHIFRFNNPEQARKLKAEGAENPAGSNAADWTFAQRELISQSGVFGKSFEEFERKKNMEMEEKLKHLEDKYR